MRFGPTKFLVSTSMGVMLLGCALQPANVYATALTIPDAGILQLSNMTGALLGLTSSPTLCFNWDGGATCAGASHTMEVSGSSSIFAVGTGTIKDVSTVPVPSFITVPGAGVLSGQTIQFDLTSIPTSVAGGGNCTSNAPFNTCMPAGSPITLTMDSTGKQVTITFDTLEDGYTGTAASGSTEYQGIFTTQQSGTLVGTGICNNLFASITNIVGCEALGGTITATWSATESPVEGGGTGGGEIPEPASMVLLAAGLLGLAIRQRQVAKL